MTANQNGSAVTAVIRDLNGNMFATMTEEFIVCGLARCIDADAVFKIGIVLISFVCAQRLPKYELAP
jgi:hypothetical protein